MVTRRQVTIAFAAGALGANLHADAQSQQRAHRVGFLSAGQTPDGAPPASLRDALRALGYVEGRNVVYESRFAGGMVERLADLAADLVRLKVDVIVTQGGSATQAAKGATSTIAIVMAPAAGDAVATGWIASLARPGGNITGMTDESLQLSAKRMQLLHEVVPRAALFAILWNVNDNGMTLRYREIEKAARILKLDVQAISVREPGDFPLAFATMTGRRPDAIFLVADVFTTTNRKKVIDFAAAQRIPAMYEFAGAVRDGGLMSFGPSADDAYRQAANHVDRILKGAKAADIPAEQPNRYYLTINRKTASSLGLTIPSSVLLRADEVID